MQALESTPHGETHWSTRGLAEATGLSRMTISRIGRAFGLQPHRADTFQLSPDPQLVDKVRAIVGLYMNPPDHALVLCVDEKSQIQALDRTQPLLPMQPGDRLTASSPSLGGIPQVPQYYRIAGASGAGGAPHRRQLRHSQNRDHPEVVRQAPPLSRALHAHLWFVDQSGRALVRRTYEQADSPWRVSQCEGVGGRYPPIH